MTRCSHARGGASSRTRGHESKHKDGDAMVKVGVDAKEVMAEIGADAREAGQAVHVAVMEADGLIDAMGATHC